VVVVVNKHATAAVVVVVVLVVDLVEPPAPTIEVVAHLATIITLIIEPLDRHPILALIWS
jgi:hypothetical protein